MGARTHYFKSARRAPIILGVLDEHPFSRRARALTIQRGTSTHCSKTNKQRASEQLQSGHERNKFMKCSLEKMGARAPIIFGGSTSTDYFGSSTSTDSQGGASTHHSESIQLENWWMNTFEYERNLKRISSWSTPLKNGGAHPLFYGGMRTHYFGGSTSTHF